MLGKLEEKTHTLTPVVGKCVCKINGKRIWGKMT